MDFNFFEYDNRTGELVFNDYQILLVKEFAKLFEEDRNKCKEDKTGKLKLLARKEFTYLFQKFAPQSPYYQYSEQEKHKEAMEDSGLTQEEFDDPDFRAACRKCQNIINSDRILKMMNSAYYQCDSITEYFDTIVDYTERDTNGKPIFDPKNVMKMIGDIGDVVSGIDKLKNLYTKGLEASSDLRSDAQPGFRD